MPIRAHYAIDTEDLVGQSLRIARDNANEERKRECDEWASYLDGDQLGSIEPNPGEKPENFARRPKLAFPFVDLILTDLSLLYKRPPARFFGDEGTAEDTAAREWIDLWEDDGVPCDPALLAMDKQCRLFGNMAVEVVADEDMGAPRWNFFSPDQVDVIQSRKRPNKAEAVILCINRADTVTSDPSHYRVWTPEKTWRIEGGRVKDEEDNRLKRIPVTFFANTVEHQRFWSPGWGAKIVNQNRVFDRMWSSLLWLCVVQAHSVLKAKNVDPTFREDVLKKSGWWPGMAFLLGPDGELGFETPSPAIAPMLEVLAKIVETTYWTCGLPINRFRQTTTPQSGYAYMVEQMSVLEDREARATIFKPRERRLWRDTFDVANAYGYGPAAPKDIVIDYAKVELPVPSQERLEETKWKLEQHLVSVVDLIMAEDPDLTEEDAVARLQENKALNDAVFQKTASRGSSVAEFLKSVGIGKDAGESSNLDKGAMPPAMGKEVGK